MRKFAPGRIAGGVLLTLHLSIVSAGAAPFAEKIPFTQPDGTKIVLWGEGDEFYADIETLDGFTVVFNPATRAYHYAQLSADASRLEPTSAVVGRDDPARLGLQKQIRISAAARSRQVQERFARWDAGMEVTRRWEELKAARRLADAQGILAPPSFTTTGTKIGLCLLIDFSDDVATVAQSEIDGYCNGTNYTGYGNNGSVRKYFSDVSGGLLNYSNVVTLYIRMVQPKSYYNDTTKDCGAQGNLLIRDAIAIMTNLPNYATEILPAFSHLTVDADNNVVACNVFYAGGNGGVWSYGLWPHSWSLYNVGAQYLSPGGKKVYKYQITNIGTSLALGTFCHENGHMLCGYPDIYDYDYDSKGGAGIFCLMNSGGHGVNPVQVCAYLKRASGWATTVELNSNSVLTAVAGTTGTNFNRFFRYQKPGVNTEYYLIENRQKSGRDANLPGGGLAIWHIDELGNKNYQNMTPNTTHTNYEVTLVQADNLWHFQNNINTGDAYDLYYLGNTAAAYSGRLNDGTTPHAHWWDGGNSRLKIHGISASSTAMTFGVGAEAPVLVLDGTLLTAENCAPTNGAVDPFETVTVAISIRNAGGGITTNLVATLLPQGGVVAPSAPQSYGALGPTAVVSRSFTFTAVGTCGSTVYATLQLQDGSLNYGTVTGSFVLGSMASGSTTLTNSTAIAIPVRGAADPYPSELIVSSMPTNPSRITVTLSGVTHTYPDDLDILLVGPAGQKVVLMSDAGGGGDVTDIDLTFDDAAASAIPDASVIGAGAYRPADYGTLGESLPSPAPSAPYSTFLAAFSNQNPNGTWSLYVNDDGNGDSGSISGGWRLTFTHKNYTCCFDSTPPDLAVAVDAQPQCPSTGDLVTCRITVTNLGGFAFSAAISNALPFGLTYTGHSLPWGTFTPAAGLWSFSNLPFGASAWLSVTSRVAAGAAESTLTDRVSVAAANPADAVSSNDNATTRIYVNPSNTPLLFPGSPVVSADPDLQNNAGDAFDMATNGHYVATRNAGGFGGFGRMYFNYDRTNLYLGAIGADVAGDNNGMIVFLGLNTLTNNAVNLWGRSGAPAALDALDNLAFGPSVDIAIVLGDEYGDGTSPSFNLGSGSDFGQGVFAIGPTSFVPVAGARLSQYDGAGTNQTSGADDDSNRLTDRWEVSIPWSSLGAPSGIRSLRALDVAGVLASDGVSGSNRYLSGNFVGSGVTNLPSLDEFNNVGFEAIQLRPTLLTQPTCNVSIAVSALANPVILGSNSAFHITVSNSGPRAASGVIVTSDIPSGAVFIDASSSQGTCDFSGGRMTCDLGLLAPGAAAFITSMVQTATAGTLTNKVATTPFEVETTTTNNQAVALLSVQTPAVLEVSPAAVDFGFVQTGSTAQTTLSISNGGQYVLSGTILLGEGGFSLASTNVYSLSGGSATSAVLQFHPDTLVPHSNTVVFSSSGGTTNVTVRGYGAALPIALFSASPTQGLAPLAVTFTDLSTGTITNRTWAFGDGDTSNTTETVVEHTYLSTGTFTVALVVSGPLGQSTNEQEVLALASNQPPELIVQPAALDFGGVLVGQSVTQTVELVNAGKLTLTGTASVGGPFTLPDASSFSLEGGSTGLLSVAYAPAGAGADSNDVAIASNGGDFVLPVTGTGLNPAHLVVSPELLDFGTVETGTTAQLSLAVSNSGDVALSGVAAVTGGPFALDGDGTLALPAGSSSNLILRFSPEIEGMFSNDLIVATDAGGSTNALLGVGAIMPIALFSASPTQGLAPLAVTFTDLSTGTITNRTWAFGDGDTSNTTETVVEHTYLSTGTFTVALVVSGPLGQSTSEQEILALASNRPPVLIVQPAALDFGGVLVGQSVTQTVELVNAGELTLTGTASFGGPFTLPDASSFSVEGGSTGLLSVAYAPAVAGADSNDVAIASNGGDFVLPVAGTGLDPAQADLALSLTDSPDPVILNNTLVYTIRVANSGPDTVMGVTVSNTLPAGVVFNPGASSPECVETNGFIVCGVGAMGIDTDITFQISVAVSTGTTGVITNRVVISSETADPVEANNVAVEPTAIPDSDGDGAPDFSDPDDDNDGIPDDFEILHGLNRTNALDAAADGDTDGFANIEEYIAATDPEDSNSYHRVMTVDMQPPVMILFPSATGRYYSLEYSGNLLEETWTGLSSNVPGTGGILGIPDTNSAPDRHYRVGVQLP